MTNPEPNPLARKTLWVSEHAHSAVGRMQKRLRKPFGPRVTQEDVVMRGIEAIERELELEQRQ